MGRLKPSERTERRVQMFVDRGLFKQKTDVMDAAIELLVRQQMEKESVEQAARYQTDETAIFMQEDTLNGKR